jgi:hypothetical protein
MPLPAGAKMRVPPPPVGDLLQDIQAASDWRFRSGPLRYEHARRTSPTPTTMEALMDKRSSTIAQSKVEKTMRERNRGTLRSGSSGKKVTSRKQAIAIGLAEARRAGAKLPRKKKS